jgi:hypothetical protein
MQSMNSGTAHFAWAESYGRTIFMNLTTGDPNFWAVVCPSQPVVANTFKVLFFNSPRGGFVLLLDICE